MKILMFAALLLLAAGAILWQRRAARAPDQPVARVETTFAVSIPGAYEKVAPLFGAWAERAWADDWKPEFIYPRPPRDELGEVFLVSHGHRDAIWVNTAFDLRGGFIQYVHMIPETLVTVIDIHLDRISPSMTQA